MLKRVHKMQKNQMIGAKFATKKRASTEVNAQPLLCNDGLPDQCTFWIVLSKITL